jgi:hypothetical protein
MLSTEYTSLYLTASDPCGLLVSQPSPEIRGATRGDLEVSLVTQAFNP